MATDLDTVLDILEAESFERLPMPLVVGGTTFNFDAAVRGTGTFHDLVILATGATQTERLIRLVSALAAALDRVGSRRPITIVTLGETPSAGMRTALEQQARLLPVMQGADRQQIEHILSVLMPLKLPDVDSRGGDPLGEVAQLLGSNLSAEHSAFIEAARSGSEAVRELLCRYIDTAARGETPQEGGQ